MARRKRKGAYRRARDPREAENRTEWTQLKENQFHRNLTHAGSVKWHRIGHDITQKELAKQMRITAGCLCTRESGKVNLTLEQEKQHLEAIQAIVDRRAAKDEA